MERPESGSERGERGTADRPLPPARTHTRRIRRFVFPGWPVDSVRWSRPGLEVHTPRRLGAVAPTAPGKRHTVEQGKSVYRDDDIKATFPGHVVRLNDGGALIRQKLIRAMSSTDDKGMIPMRRDQFHAGRYGNQDLFGALSRRGGTTSTLSGREG
ncbi:hypothetical protein [Azospirillum argentinense]